MSTLVSNKSENKEEAFSKVKIEKKERRPRRSKITLQRDVLDAVAYLVGKDGFSNINLTSIAQESDVNINAILRNFISLDRLLDRYAQIFDYWYDDIVKKSEREIESQDETLLYSNILKTITEAIYRDKNVRQLLLWEMTEENETTKRAAYNREYTCQKLFKVYEAIFKDSGLDIEVITALIVGGINYLTFRRKRTRFLGVDYSTTAGRDKLMKTISDIVGLVFAALEQQNKMLSAARKLKDRGVDVSMLSECFDIDISLIEAR